MPGFLKRSDRSCIISLPAATAYAHLLKFRKGRLPTFRYFEKYLQQINAFERGGGSIGIDKGIVSYVETWHEDVLDAHPGPPPLQPDAPQVFGGERIDVYTSAEMDANQRPP